MIAFLDRLRRGARVTCLVIIIIIIINDNTKRRRSMGQRTKRRSLLHELYVPWVHFCLTLANNSMIDIQLYAMVHACFSFRRVFP